MNKIIILMLIFTSTIFAEYRFDNVLIKEIKLESSVIPFNKERDKELEFSSQKIGISDFQKNSNVTIMYEGINLSVLNAVNLSFKISYKDNKLDDSSNQKGILSFKLKDIFNEVPKKQEGSFKIKFELEFKPLVSTTTQTQSRDLTFFYDTIPPDTVKNLKAAAGDKSLNISWKYTKETKLEEIQALKLYYKKQNETKFKVKELTGASTEYKLKGLENEVTYQLYIKTIDNAGNESENSQEISATPVPVDDFYKYYRKSGGKEDGGYCFIATAAYGSYDHGMVKVLRKFRDLYLPKSVVNFYYKHSPVLANKIAKSQFLSFIIRILLEPFVLYAKFMMFSHIAFKILLLLLFSVLLFFKLKARRLAHA